MAAKGIALFYGTAFWLMAVVLGEVLRWHLGLQGDAAREEGIALLRRLLRTLVDWRPA